MQFKVNKISSKTIPLAQRDQNSWARNNCDIMCGNCNSMIYGFQYKCLECDDYDLCSFCQKKECHGDHMMIRFTQTFNQNVSDNFCSLFR